MIHFLRTAENRTIVEVEVLLLKTVSDDLRAVIVIEEYSRLLLNLLSTNPVRVPDFIKEFMALQELRGEWFENPPADKDYGPDAFVTSRFKEVASRWDLNYVVD